MRATLCLVLSLVVLSPAALAQEVPAQRPFTTPTRQPAAAAPASRPAPAGGGALQRPAAALPSDDALVDDSPIAEPPANSRFGNLPTSGGATPPSDSRFPAAAAPPANIGTLSDETDTSGSTISGVAPRTGAPRTLVSPSTTTVSPSPRTPATMPAANPSRTAAPVNPDAASPVAEMLLKQSLEPRQSRSLTGDPLSLAEVLERVTGREDRILTVQTYWKLVTKLAAYHGALDDKALFAQINVRQLPPHERAALAAVQLAAKAAAERAELEVVIAQNELSQMARLNDAQAQCLPSDVPLVSQYRTEFETLYSAGAVPAMLGRLNRQLPYHLKDVRARADAVVAAQQGVQAMAEAVSTGQASVASLSEAHRILLRERIAFVSSVYDYNAAIAEYAFHAVPNSSSSTAVGMLIKTRPATRSAAVSSEGGVIVVSAEQSVEADRAPVLSGSVTSRTLPSQPTQNQLPANVVPEDARSASGAAQPSPRFSFGQQSPRFALGDADEAPADDLSVEQPHPSETDGDAAIQDDSLPLERPSIPTQPPLWQR